MKKFCLCQVVAGTYESFRRRHGLINLLFVVLPIQIVSCSPTSSSGNRYGGTVVAQGKIKNYYRY